MADDYPIAPTEYKRRRTALLVLALMILIFIGLSAFSFVGSRSQVVPETITYADAHNAVDGKRVFQAYNCMGCHTIVGNGAYFGPDLTNTYESAGPAWIAAFLPSAASWPTEAALRVQLQHPNVIAETGVSDLDAYYALFPGAKERVERRGGRSTFMPNLPFKAAEVQDVIAFLKYTSLMDTEGWPPKPKVNGLEHPLATKTLSLATATAAVAGAATPPPTLPAAPSEPLATAADTAAHGKELAQQYGCLACHATDSTRQVGPGWGGIYGTTTQLEGGGTALIDDAYLAESITDPDAQVVAGYPKGVMPAYANVLSADEVDAIVAYIRSLESR